MVFDVASPVLPTSVGASVPYTGELRVEALGRCTDASFLLDIQDDAVKNSKSGAISTSASTNVPPDQRTPSQLGLETEEDETEHVNNTVKSLSLSEQISEEDGEEIGSDDPDSDESGDEKVAAELLDFVTKSVKADEALANTGEPRCEIGGDAEARVEHAIPSPAEAAGSSTLINALAFVLNNLALRGMRQQQMTSFHAVRAPKLPLHEYLERIANYFGCGEDCLVACLVYIDRVTKLHPDFVVSPLSIHRILVTSAVVAAKFLDDIYFSNKHYARVGGMQHQELNALEKKFLQLIEWKLHIQPEEYQRYRNYALVQYSMGMQARTGIGPVQAVAPQQC